MFFGVSERLQHFPLFLLCDFALQEDVPAVRKVFAAKMTLPLLIVDGESVGEHFEVKTLNFDIRRIIISLGCSGKESFCESIPNKDRRWKEEIK